MTRKNKFIDSLKSNNDKFQIKFKDKSLLMKVLSVILFFNPKFATKFITTIGNTIYFPSAKNLEERSEESVLMTLSHEYQHVKDYQSNKIWFIFSYLFPISLLPFCLLSFLILPWFVSLLLLLVCLAPLPSYWRCLWEVKGYSMSLFVANELAVEQKLTSEEKDLRLKKMADYYEEHFTSFEYYLMWPFGVKKKMDKVRNDIVSGELKKSDVIFSEVVKALEESKG